MVMIGTNGRNGYILDLRPIGPLRSILSLTAPGRKGDSVLVCGGQHDPYDLDHVARVFKESGATLYIVDDGISGRMALARQDGVVLLTSSEKRAALMYQFLLFCY